MHRRECWPSRKQVLPRKCCAKPSNPRFTLTFQSLISGHTCLPHTTDGSPYEGLGIISAASAETLGEIHDLLSSQQEARLACLTLEYQTEKNRNRLGYGCSEARYEKLGDTWGNFCHPLPFQL